jgi:hypothetical protein
MEERLLAAAAAAGTRPRCRCGSESGVPGGIGTTMVSRERIIPYSAPTVCGKRENVYVVNARAKNPSPTRF